MEKQFITNDRIKYPRTFHLPWSLGITDDDKVMKSLEGFIGKEVVVLEKRDGENTTMTNGYVHARSVDSKDHYTRHFVKSMHANIRYLIPYNYRICGENLHYTKSITYNNLRDYFEVFSIWNGYRCLSWDDTINFCKELCLFTVPVLYEIKFDEDFLKEISLNLKRKEGYVIRVKESFNYHNFHKYVGKFVRKNHVQTDEHWMNRTDLKKNTILKN